MEYGSAINNDETKQRYRPSVTILYHILIYREALNKGVGWFLQT
jgi:hypothetical protein